MLSLEQRLARLERGCGWTPQPPDVDVDADERIATGRGHAPQPERQSKVRDCVFEQVSQPERPAGLLERITAVLHRFRVNGGGDDEKVARAVLNELDLTEDGKPIDVLRVAAHAVDAAAGVKNTFPMPAAPGPTFIARRYPPYTGGGAEEKLP